MVNFGCSICTLKLVVCALYEDSHQYIHVLWLPPLREHCLGPCPAHQYVLEKKHKHSGYQGQKLRMVDHRPEFDEKVSCHNMLRFDGQRQLPFQTLPEQSEYLCTDMPKLEYASEYIGTLV